MSQDVFQGVYVWKLPQSSGLASPIEKTMKEYIEFWKVS